MKYDNGKENEIYVAIPFITLTLEKNDKKYWNATTAHFQIYGFTCSNFSILKLLNIYISKYPSFEIFQFSKSYFLYIYYFNSWFPFSAFQKRIPVKNKDTAVSRQRRVDFLPSIRISWYPFIRAFAMWCNPR